MVDLEAGTLYFILRVTPSRNVRTSRQPQADFVPPTSDPSSVNGQQSTFPYSWINV
jgi:hypothetical protein